MRWTSSTAPACFESSGPRAWTPPAHTARAAPSPSAVAAGLAQDMAVEDAVARAKEYVTEAIRRAFPMGGGHGPLNHFYRTW